MSLNKEKHFVFDTIEHNRSIGAPAEQQLVSRPYFVRDGYFQDVDVALHNHIGKEFGTVYGLRQKRSSRLPFKGQSAHAATAPWNAKDAVDAVVPMPHYLKEKPAFE